MASLEIEIRLNGELRLIPSGWTLLDLLEEVGRDPRTVAIELNGAIIRQGSLGSHRVADGDRVEVVHFVQGG